MYLSQERNVCMFAGKGGVGKSTCAAVTALHLASQGRRTLLISTDPAPSLSDIFERQYSPGITEILENLYLEEINLEGVRDRWKRKFGSEVYEVISAYLPVDLDFIDYVAEAPGIGDEFMLDYIRGLVNDKEHEYIVWDTAPGGHTLRLLALPAQFIEHMNAAVKVYSRLKKTVQTKRSILGVLNSWKELSQQVWEFLQQHTEFVVVTIPEALSLHQTERILKEVQGYGITPSRIIVNGVIRESDSEFLHRRQVMQEKYITEIRSLYGKELEINEVLLLPSEVKGVRSLRPLEKELFPEVMVKEAKSG